MQEVIKNNYTYLKRYMPTTELCKVHGFGRSSLFKWMNEWKLQFPGVKFPGVINLKGSKKMLLWDPVQFHDEFLVPYKFDVATSQITNFILITNNKQRKKI